MLRIGIAVEGALRSDANVVALHRSGRLGPLVHRLDWEARIAERERNITFGAVNDFADVVPKSQRVAVELNGVFVARVVEQIQQPFPGPATLTLSRIDIL